MTTSSPNPIDQRFESVAPTLAPALLTIKQTAAYTGISRTRIYEVIDRLDARKFGRRTLITKDSVDRFIADLPRQWVKPE
jgi:excisionase family DNA binding protein